ncbi:hypothetical protein AK51_03385 [Serratia nematodiphila DZ0503SBS1]|nr:hypothetical protein AK51_03385 [Serratia nematodiphila DZ0503SBS1]
MLQACDHALALKRLVRMVAENHNMQATFMAKPYEEHAGSGMHVHISMLNAQGDNVFADDDGEDSALLKQALAGMIALMPSSMALLARTSTPIAVSSPACMCRPGFLGA